MLPIKYHITIRNSRIYDISPSDETIIETEGKTYKFSGYVVPGFVDAHGHIAALGQSLAEPDLRHCQSPEECALEAQSAKTLRGGWLVGFGWNQELWESKLFPHKFILDKHFRDTPVFLRRIDGHAAWLNSKALDIAGITSYSPNPPGGEIKKDKAGNPTGIIIDTAMDRLFEIIPPYSPDQIRKHIIDACKSLAEYGVTYVHDMDVDPAIAAIFANMDKTGELPIRVDSYLKSQNILPDIDKLKSGNNLFNIKGLKFYADGAFGSRGAALIDDYSDSPGEKGLILIDSDTLYNKAIYAVSKGLHIAVHAIGDMAAKITLNAYKSIINEYPEAILRMEHCQIIAPEDIELFAELGIIASVQPIHCTSDAASIADSRLGQRCNYAYPWITLINKDITLLGGSDFPIESHNPLTGIDAFVNRIPIGGKNSWQAHEKIGLPDALEAYTVSTRRINNMNYNGLEIGTQADITVIDSDLSSNILDANVLATFVNGKLISINS